MDYAKIALKLRGQIGRFSGELAAGFPKVVRRFIAEMLYGIQARQSVRLTEVARALNETTSIKKTEERLSRQLGRRWLGEAVTERVAARAAREVDWETLLILDLTDLSKKYAKKMEYLGRIRDASAKELGWGYWMVNVIGAGARRVYPLYGRLFSHRAPEHRSENAEIERAIGTVSDRTEGRGVWVIDRGGDRRELFRYLLDRKLRFLIRLNDKRGLEVEGRRMSAQEAAASCPLVYIESLPAKNDRGPLRLTYGCRRVRLPGRTEILTLVVVRGFGEAPLILLTNLTVSQSRKSLWRVVAGYMARWRVEEAIRFIKQSYRLEDIRLLTYRRLQNMIALVMAVVYFASVYLDAKLKLRVLSQHVLKAARRVFGIPDFRLYALADGIKHCLFSRSPGVRGLSAALSPSNASPPFQLPLFDS